MLGTLGRILKSKDVILDGQYHLDIKKIEVAGVKPQEEKKPSVPVRVRILENHSEYAVLEVTCVCGTRVCLRCDYGSAQTTHHSQIQNESATEPNEMK